MRLKIAVTSLALMAAMAVPAMAQDRGWYDQNGVYHQSDRDRDHDRDDRWHREHDRDRDHDRYNNGYYNGGYNNNGRYNTGYGNPGFQMGMRDGLNDGQTARARGNSSYGPGWKHPDRGYSSNMGDKRTYEQQYRAGYQQGFQEGMNRGGYNRGPWGR
jgi:Ni/Co efflux regulator RcnB